VVHASVWFQPLFTRAKSAADVSSQSPLQVIMSHWRGVVQVPHSADSGRQR